MRFPLIFFVFLCLFASMTNAQFKTIAEGELFEEPEDGDAKILQM